MNILKNRIRMTCAWVCLAALLPNTLFAKQRSQQQMLNAAVHALSASSQKVGKAMAYGTNVKQLVAADGYTIYGNNGGFAVIANDDVVPALLGYSHTAYNTGVTNPNFQSWLDAVNQMVQIRAKEGTPVVRATKPDTGKYAEAVDALCATTWGQDEPYNNMCPIATDGTGRCLTGCAATSTAQVLYYHKGPKHGMGQRTIYYPQNDITGVAISVDYEKDVYNWNGMIDVYSKGSYTSEEGDAVALLMRDCGVAADMEYGSDAQGGSGALHKDLAQGLQRYFGLTDVQYIQRADYTESEWMDIIYNQINKKQPIVYGGFTKSREGHSFVLDGYDAEGMVHINWGWEGSQNGYFDIALLNPTGYEFTELQEAIINILPESAVETKSDIVTVEQPGTLRSLIDAVSFYNYDVLKVNGNINAVDIRTLREMSGVDENGNRTHGHLRVADLSDANIVAGDDYYALDKGSRLVIKADNTLPDKLFSNTNLEEIDFPSAGIHSFGTGVWAYSNKLATVKLTAATDATFAVEDNLVYNGDKTQLLAVVPLTRNNVEVPRGVTTVADYAFAGCSMVRKVALGADVKSIGKEAFGYCWSMEELKIHSKDVPQLTGADVFSGANTESCNLAVRAGSKTRFASLAQWKDFKNIVEFGTTVKVRNLSREYGDENPKLAFTISGDKVEGTPELTCEATPLSGVGRYKITISRGTIASEDVEFEDGYLIVKPAPLEVIAEDAVREAGKANPVFTLRYEGFKNGEDADVLNEKPVATCVADETSAEGTYDIVVSGGDADNYDLSYTNGKLTVTKATGIEAVTDGKTTGPVDVYTLSGQMVRRQTSDLSDLPAGIYVVKGKKVVIAE